MRMTIKAYLKPSCGWSNGVRAVLRKHALDYDDIDIIGDRASYAEMVRKSGQPLSPCVEIDGVMLADVSGEEVENYLLSNDLVKPTEVAAAPRRTRAAPTMSTPRWRPKRSASSDTESSPYLLTDPGRSRKPRTALFLPKRRHPPLSRPPA
jgi:monothiol glutaredoxin